MTPPDRSRLGLVAVSTAAGLLAGLTAFALYSHRPKVGDRDSSDARARVDRKELETSVNSPNAGLPPSAVRTELHLSDPSERASVKDESEEDTVRRLLREGTPEAVERLVAIYAECASKPSCVLREQILKGLAKLADRRLADRAIRACVVHESLDNTRGLSAVVFAGTNLISVWGTDRANADQAEILRQARLDLLVESDPRLQLALIVPMVIVPPEGIATDLASVYLRTNDPHVQNCILNTISGLKDKESALMVYRDCLTQPIGYEEVILGSKGPTTQIGTALSGLGRLTLDSPEVTPEAVRLVLGLAARPDLNELLSLKVLETMQGLDPSQVEAVASSLHVSSPEIEGWLDKFRWAQEFATKKKK